MSDAAEIWQLLFSRQYTCNFGKCLACSSLGHQLCLSKNVQKNRHYQIVTVLTFRYVTQGHQKNTRYRPVKQFNPNHFPTLPTITPFHSTTKSLSIPPQQPTHSPHKKNIPPPPPNPNANPQTQTPQQTPPSPRSPPIVLRCWTTTAEYACK